MLNVGRFIFLAFCTVNTFAGTGSYAFVHLIIMHVQNTVSTSLVVWVLSKYLLLCWLNITGHNWTQFYFTCLTRYL